MYRGVVRSPGLVILFTILTCGIYGLYWYYAFANDMKNFLNEPEIKPGLELFLIIITCGIYGIYWWYKYGKVVFRAQLKANIPASDNSVPFLILGIFGLNIVLMPWAQSMANKVWRAV